MPGSHPAASSHLRFVSVTQLQPLIVQLMKLVRNDSSNLRTWTWGKICKVLEAWYRLTRQWRYCRHSDLVGSTGSRSIIANKWTTTTATDLSINNDSRIEPVGNSSVLVTTRSWHLQKTSIALKRERTFRINKWISTCISLPLKWKTISLNRTSGNILRLQIECNHKGIT